MDIISSIYVSVLFAVVATGHLEAGRLNAHVPPPSPPNRSWSVGGFPLWSMQRKTPWYSDKSFFFYLVMLNSLFWARALCFSLSHVCQALLALIKTIQSTKMLHSLFGLLHANRGGPKGDPGFCKHFILKLLGKVTPVGDDLSGGPPWDIHIPEIKRCPP